MARAIVITGANSGIGKATAAVAEARGWKPIRADLNGGDVEADLATPQGRLAFAEEIAELLLWLASPAHSLMVGQMLFIDGGAEATVRGDTLW